MKNRLVLLGVVAIISAFVIGGDAVSQYRRPIPAQPCLPKKITIPANEFAKSDNVAPASGEAAANGVGVILNAPPYNERPNAVTYLIDVRCPGTYILRGEYAAETPRPVQVYLNRVLVIGVALDLTTGGWLPDKQEWRRMGPVTLRAGTNELLIRSGRVFPHIRTFELVPTF